MQNQINEIYERITKMELAQLEQGSDIKEIKGAIIGSDLNPNGVTKRLKKLEEWAEKTRKHGYIGAGIVIAVTAIKTGWDKLVDFFTMAV